MIKDYKGEMPKNVTTPDKAKAKKPFYKDWKFWVLTGLMTLFGACSIYGLVLGSQYVKAVNEAAHIIADAQENSDKVFSGLKKARSNAIFDNLEDVAYLDLGTLSWSKIEGENTTIRFIASNSTFNFPSNTNITAKMFCADYLSVSWARLFYTDKCLAGTYSNANYIGIVDSAYNNSTANEFKQAVTGKILYYYPRAGSSYQSVYGAGYDEGYQEGSSDGYEDGYQEGYSEGSDAINVPQSLKVLLPVGNQYSVQYSSYVDGVLDQQGQINSSESAGAWALFTRSRNQKLRVDLTLPVDSKAFWDFRSGWTSGTEVAGDYIALQESWAVDGVTYLPTWVGEPQLFVSVVGTDVPDLTYRTISIAFDVAHWGDIKVGAYQQGYQQGYVDGQENPTAYNSGYDAGYADGQAQGETDGFNRGVAVGSSGSQSLAMMFKTAFQLPFDQLYRFLNFNLLGINFLALFTALISVSIGIMVIKKVL